MKTNEIIYAIREGLKEYVDDTKYTDDYLMYLVRLNRAVFIRREYNNQQRIIDTEIIQNIFMDVEEVDDEECGKYIFCNNGCSLIRTVKPIPFTLELHNKNLIMSIRSAERNVTIPFNIITPEKAIYAGEGQYEKKQIFAIPHSDGHIYFKSKHNIHRGLEAVIVSAVFENPDDAAQFKCGTKPCYDIVEDRYPCKAWMEALIINTVIEKLAPLKSLPRDEVNNSNDDNG
jgi:hypothetical protein